MSRLQTHALVGLAVFGVLALLYLPFLLGPEGRIASNALGDATRYFAFARAFAADHVAAGEIPLWNPHLFSGVPFVGAFQTSVFYPLNVLYLWLPTDRAINVDLALHLGILAASTYLWLLGARVRPFAAAVGAGIVMLSGPTFLRALAGQLTVLATLAWAPLVLLAIDRLVERPRLSPVLLGTMAGGLMLLAGHPPTAYMSALVFGVYVLLALRRAATPTRVAPWLVAMALGPPLLAAVQLLPGLDVAREAIRADGMTYAFATTFSFPPENLLTAVVPEAFGNAEGFRRTYWGRWMYWDASAFVGIVALLLAVHGAGRRGDPTRRAALWIIPITLVLALGRYTPIYAWLFDLIPGFDRMRAPSKFMFYGALFTGALAAVGFDRLLAGEMPRRGMKVAAAVGLGVLGGLWLGLVLMPPLTEGSPIRAIADLAGRTYGPERLARWHAVMQANLLVALLVSAAAAAPIWIRRGHRFAPAMLAGLAAFELLSFAWGNRGGAFVAIEYQRRPNLAATYRAAGDDRVLSVGMTSNVAMNEGGYELWGNESVVLQRYAELVARSQGRDVESLNNIGGRPPQDFHPIFAMLRGRFSVARKGEVAEYPEPMPRFLLFDRYAVQSDGEVLDALFEADFDPTEKVLLEAEPDPQPEASGTPIGTVRWISESSDTVEVEVALSRPAILVATDAYAEGWVVRDAMGVAYPVVPAQHVLRAVALPAGQHALTFEYAPRSYRIGLGITLVAVAIYGIAGAFAWRRWAAERGA